MVKGISRQVIVVRSPEPKLFEQAIFILNDDVVGRDGVTDEALMQEAKKLLHTPARRKRSTMLMSGAVWAAGGALLMGLIWLLTALL